MVLSESEFGHQALSDIVPVRDLFGLLFFASVGMLLDPNYLFQNAGLVVGGVLVFSLGKGAIFAGVTRAFGYKNVVPLATALGLFQVGEFAFVLARVGVDDGSLSQDLYSFVLTVAILTMALTPVVSGFTSKLYQFSRSRSGHPPAETMDLPSDQLVDHIVVAGGGRHGRRIGEVLNYLGSPHIVIELDQRRFEGLKESGVTAIYGDATSAYILEAAHVAKARLVLVTTPDIAVTIEIVKRVRAQNPTAKLVARGDGPQDVRALLELKVSEVVEPEFEAALEMMRQGLLHLGLPFEQINEYAERVRHVRDTTPDQLPMDRATLVEDLSTLSVAATLRWHPITEAGELSNVTLGSAAIRSRTGASVVAVQRDGMVTPNPGPEFKFRVGDSVAILATPAQHAAFVVLARLRESIDA
jgi:CPA2 family monovalent cation:H+ antiporter-2